jgi:hypothetical protein
LEILGRPVDGNLVRADSAWWVGWKWSGSTSDKISLRSSLIRSNAGVHTDKELGAFVERVNLPLSEAVFFIYSVGLRQAATGEGSIEPYSATASISPCEACPHWVAGPRVANDAPGRASKVLLVYGQTASRSRLCGLHCLLGISRHLPHLPSGLDLSMSFSM